MNTNHCKADFLKQAYAGFDACYPAGKQSAVIVAVSGGSDSMALLLLAKSYFTEHHADCRLIAVTVDHQLRPESAQEAAGVAIFCKQLGISHQILCWDAAKPDTGMASAARDARYGLLVEAAHANSAKIIFTGHTADDQVETYLMRSQRSMVDTDEPSEMRGLAAMASQTLLQNRVLLCRPLLKIWRQTLRDYLQACDTAWYDDPSNDNLTYERPRMRMLAAQTDKQAVLDAVHQAGYLRQQNNRRVAKLLKRNLGRISLLSGGGLVLPHGWDEGDTGVAPLALAYLLAAIGGHPLLPPVREVAALSRQLQSAPLTGWFRRTLHHCVVEKSAKSLKIWRERRNLPTAMLQAGESMVWDGRFHISNHAEFPVKIMVPTAPQLSGYLRGHQIKVQQIHRDCLMSAPAILRDDALAEIPALADLVPRSLPVVLLRSYACFDKVLSGHDFEVGPVVKELLTMPLNHKYR